MQKVDRAGTPGTRNHRQGTEGRTFGASMKPIRRSVCPQRWNSEKQGREHSRRQDHAGQHGAEA